MDGEDSWRFLYDDIDDDLLRFVEGDMAAPTERQQPQQVHVDAQPAYPVATAAADAQAVVFDQQMTADLQSAASMAHLQYSQPSPAMLVELQEEPFMVHLQEPHLASVMPVEHKHEPSMMHLQYPQQLAPEMLVEHQHEQSMAHLQYLQQPAPSMPVEHQQEPSMVHLQYIQPAPAMPVEYQQEPFMEQLQYPQQPAPAMALQHQQMPGESPAMVPLPPGHHTIGQQGLGQSTATVHFHDGQYEHTIFESSSAVPLHHLQMLDDSPDTMQLQLLHQQMQDLGEPSPEVMPTLQYEQMMVDLPAAYLLQVDQIPMASQLGGVDQFFADEPAPQQPDFPGGDVGLTEHHAEQHLPVHGGSGAASIPDPEPPVMPPAVAPTTPAPEQESCEDCHVVREVRNHSGLVTFSVHRASDGAYTHGILELKGIAAQGPNSGTQRIYKSLRDLTPESAPQYVESCIQKMSIKAGPLENVIGGGAASSSHKTSAPPADGGPSRAPARNRRRAAPAGTTPAAAAPPPPTTSSGPPQQREEARCTEQEDEETRKYLRDAAAKASKELAAVTNELRTVRNKKAQDNGRRAVYTQIRELNHKIKKFEKGSSKRAGSELTKIRREVDGIVMEKGRLYATIRELMQRGDKKNCHNLPPRGNDDDQASGSGAAGAAVS